MGALYMECSSKEFSGVTEIFDKAIDIAVRGQDELNAEAEAARNGNKRNTYGGASSTAATGMPVRKKKRSACKIL